MMSRFKMATILSISLAFTLMVPYTQSQQCSATCSAPGQGYAFEAADHSGDYLYLGGIFGVHDTNGNLRDNAFQNMEAFLWAGRTFRDRYPNALQDVSIGAIAFDSNLRSDTVIQQVLNLESCQLSYGSLTHMVDPQRLMGYIGHESFPGEDIIADFFANQEKLLIGHADSSQASSDIPSLLRTSPSDNIQVKAIVAVIREMDWKYVQTVAVDFYPVKEAMEEFKTYASQSGICTVNSEVIPHNNPNQNQMDQIIKGLSANSDTKAVVVFGSSSYIRLLLEAAARADARGRFIWIAPKSWGTDMELVKGLEEYAEGAITLTLDDRVDGADDFLDAFQTQTSSSTNANPWLQEYIQDNNLSSTTMDEYVPYTIQAVDALLNGVEDVRSQSCTGNGLCNTFLSADSKWAEIFEAVVTSDIPVAFNRSTGDVLDGKFLVHNFRRPHGNCPGHCYTEVGEYSSANDGVNFFKGDMHFYDSSGNRIRDVKSVCGVYPCVVCNEMPTTAVTTTTDPPSPGPGGVADSLYPPTKLREGTWVIVLIALAGLGIFLVVTFEIIILVKLSGTEIFTHWKSMWAGQILLLAIFFCYLVLFAFVPSPTKATCGIIRFGVGGSYSMCFAILLVKLMIILSSEKYGSLKGSYQFFMFLFAWGVQLAVDIEWLILRHPGAHRDNTYNGWSCNTDLYDHVKSLVYIMALIVLCTCLAIKAHGTRANHRESIFIGLACGFTIPIWLVWILVGLLKDDIEYHDPALAFGLFATATIILLFMFLPKVRQVCRGVDYEDDYIDGVPSILHGGGGSVILTPSGPGSVSGGSVIHTKAEPVVPVQSVNTISDTDNVILLPNGGVYTQPPARNIAYQHDENALYLKHPGTPTTTFRADSVHSMPVNHVYSGPQVHSIYGTTPRVLHVSGDLSGRPYYGPAKRTARSVGGASSRDGTVRKTRSIQDLGSL